MSWFPWAHYHAEMDACHSGPFGSFYYAREELNNEASGCTYSLVSRIHKAPSRRRRYYVEHHLWLYKCPTSYLLSFSSRFLWHGFTLLSTHGYLCNASAFFTDLSNHAITLTQSNLQQCNQASEKSRRTSTTSTKKWKYSTPTWRMSIHARFQMKQPSPDLVIPLAQHYSPRRHESSMHSARSNWDGALGKAGHCIPIRRSRAIPWPIS